MTDKVIVDIHLKNPTTPSFTVYCVNDLHQTYFIPSGATLLVITKPTPLSLIHKVEFHPNTIYYMGEPDLELEHVEFGTTVRNGLYNELIVPIDTKNVYTNRISGVLGIENHIVITDKMPTFLPHTSELFIMTNHEKLRLNLDTIVDFIFKYFKFNKDLLYKPIYFINTEYIIQILKGKREFVINDFYTSCYNKLREW